MELHREGSAPVASAAGLFFIMISTADSKWLKPLTIITAMLALHYHQLHINALLYNSVLQCNVHALH